MKLSTCQSIYSPALSFEQWQKERDCKNKWPKCVSQSGWDKARSSVKRGQLRWLRFLRDDSMAKCSRFVPKGGGPEEDPGQAGLECFSSGMVTLDELGD